MTVAFKQPSEANGLNGHAHHATNEASDGTNPSSVLKGNNWQEPGPAAFDFRSMFDTTTLLQ